MQMGKRSQKTPQKSSALAVWPGQGDSLDDASVTEREPWRGPEATLHDGCRHRSSEPIIVPNLQEHRV